MDEGVRRALSVAPLGSPSLTDLVIFLTLHLLYLLQNLSAGTTRPSQHKERQGSRSDGVTPNYFSSPLNSEGCHRPSLHVSTVVNNGLPPFFFTIYLSPSPALRVPVAGVTFHHIDFRQRKKKERRLLQQPSFLVHFTVVSTLFYPFYGRFFLDLFPALLPDASIFFSRSRVSHFSVFFSGGKGCDLTSSPAPSLS